MPDVAEMFCELCFDYGILRYNVGPNDPDPDISIPAISRARIINENSIELHVNRTVYVLTREWTVFFSAFAGGYIELTAAGRTLLSIQIENSYVNEESRRRQHIDQITDGEWIDDFEAIYRQALERSRRHLTVPDIALAINQYVASRGFDVVRQSSTTGKGVRIIAESSPRAGRLLVE